MTERIDEAMRQRLVANNTSKRSSLEMNHSTAKGGYGGFFPNTPLAAATISFVLGSIFSLGFALFVSGGISESWWATWRLGYFVAAWSAFHYAEFAVTAGWNRDRCSVDSFLLDNGMEYHVANGTALAEYLIGAYFWPQWKMSQSLSLFGLGLAFGGQVLRSVAMIQAASNFSHQVAFRKVESHQLVTHGVYGWFRHPSYAGFFYWALGTQLLLLNPISFIGYSVVMLKFFSERTASEERALIQFFGNDYIQYRSRVGTWIPFVRGYMGPTSPKS